MSKSVVRASSQGFARRGPEGGEISSGKASRDGRKHFSSVAAELNHDSIATTFVSNPSLDPRADSRGVGVLGEEVLRAIRLQPLAEVVGLREARERRSRQHLQRRDLLVRQEQVDVPHPGLGSQVTCRAQTYALEEPLGLRRRRRRAAEVCHAQGGLGIWVGARLCGQRPDICLRSGALEGRCSSRAEPCARMWSPAPQPISILGGGVAACVCRCVDVCVCVCAELEEWVEIPRRW